MDLAHLHLLLNHFPIVGTLIAIAILGVGIFFKKTILTKTALVVLVVMSILAIPLLPTGEAAEEAIENLPAVEHTYIETHEELGETAVFVMVGLGILSLVTLFVFYKGMGAARILAIITFVASIAVFGLMAKVGNTGGEIRHTEIRAGGGDAVFPNMDTGAEKTSEDESDDDD